MELQTLSDSDLDEWRNHPVSVLVRSVVEASLNQQEAQCKAAYWAGKPWKEAEREALIRAKSHFNDIFDTPADDYRTMMEFYDDQPERDRPD